MVEKPQSPSAPADAAADSPLAPPEPAEAAEQPASPAASGAEAVAAASETEQAASVAVPRPVRELTGVVTSNKPDKTIIVRVDRRIKHPIYGKFIRRSSKLAAHDADNSCQMGDTVTIVQTRPISKTKFWALGRIVERATA